LTTPTGREIQDRMNRVSAYAARAAAVAQVKPDDFRRAAADVEQNDAVGIVVHQRGAAGDRQPRFGFPR
jgi:hypothetical protein